MRTIKKLWLLPMLGLGLGCLSSCTTDYYGNTAMSPGGAAALGVGAAVAGGLIGAAIERDNDRDHHHHHHGAPPPPPRPRYTPPPPPRRHR